MQIPYTKTTLDNGLDVIVHEDHQLPMVAVNLWYHVGSKNERPGRTGFAHLFEHLMFEGSAHHDSGYFEPLQRAGGLLNGSTNTDRTNYWEVVPTGALDLALWMESDRMGHLLPALTDEKFVNQRDVVLNERRQNYENRPYGLAGVALSAALFPPDHPYHWITIGDPDDLRAASLDDVRAFFETYYHPGNASLTLAGDIETDAGAGPGRALLRRDSARPPVSPPVSAGVLRPRTARCCSRTASSCRGCISAGTRRPCSTAGDAELDLGRRRAGARQDVAALSAARLRAAAWRPTSPPTSIHASCPVVFQVACDGRGRHRRCRCSSEAVTDALHEIGGGGPHGGRTGAGAGADRGAVRVPAADGRRLRRQVRSAERLQRLQGQPGLSSTPTSTRYHVGDRPPAWRRLCARWLVGQPRVALSVVPRGQRALALAGATEVAGLVTAVDRSQLPVPGRAAAVRVPRDRARDAGQRPATCV